MGVFFQDFILHFGYLAIFALTLTRSLGITAILPIPQALVLGAAVGLGLHPFVVGIVAGLASTVGDTLAYVAGSSGRKLFYNKKLKVPAALEKVVKRGGFWSVVAAGFTPLPLVYGLIAGSLHYDLRKFIFASLIGKVGGSLLVAYGGFVLIKELANI